MANVEKEVIAWLTGTIGGDWPISGDKPQQLPPQYILVDRIGGPREAMVLDRAEILIEVYSKNSRQDASDKANEIADQIIQLTNVQDITRAKVNSLVNLDDTIAQYWRYQIYCDVFLRR